MTKQRAGSEGVERNASVGTITTEGHTVKLVVVRPPGVGAASPAFMFFHGGGWVLGDFATHERFVRELVAESGATAVFVAYDRSPEARYPAAINQAYAATKWVATRRRPLPDTEHDQAGVDVIATRYNGLIHDYGLNPIRRVPGVRSALLHAAAELKKRVH